MPHTFVKARREKRVKEKQKFFAWREQENFIIPADDAENDFQYQAHDDSSK